jgi:hypothetical protein
MKENMKHYTKSILCILSAITLSSCCSFTRESEITDPDEIELAFTVKVLPSTVEMYAMKLEKEIVSLPNIDGISSTSSEGNLTVVIKSGNHKEIQDVVDRFLKENKCIKQINKQR